MHGCFYCLFMLLWQSVVPVRGSDDARLFLLFVYICIVVRDTIIREVDTPLTGSHRNSFVTSKPGPGFPRSNVMVVFGFYYLRWQVVARTCFLPSLCKLCFHTSDVYQWITCNYLKIFTVRSEITKKTQLWEQKPDCHRVLILMCLRIIINGSHSLYPALRWVTLTTPSTKFDVDYPGPGLGPAHQCPNPTGTPMS